MIFGYARVSTVEQNLETQLNALSEYGVEKIFSDKKSGKDFGRIELQRMIEQLRERDTIVVHSLSRLGRKTKDLVEFIEFLNSKEIKLVSLKENIDTQTPTGRAMVSMIAVFAQLERELTNERVKEGIKNARARGRLGGRPKKDFDKTKEALSLYYSQNYSIAEITERTGVSKATLYRRINENK